jgi:hypothetical protein
MTDKKLGPFDWIRIINFKSYDDEEISLDNGFIVYIIIQYFSQFSDTIFLAQQLNMMANLPIDSQFWFLYNSISKRKRYSKWIKRDNSPELISIMEYYNINYNRATEYLDILTSVEVKDIIKIIDQDKG